MMTETTEKHGDLFGGALTDETVGSSKKVLDKMYGAGPMTGLQQFFTPPELSQFVSKVLAPVDAVLDLTAGNGALLRPYHQMARFGIEMTRITRRMQTTTLSPEMHRRLCLCSVLLVSGSTG